MESETQSIPAQIVAALPGITTSGGRLYLPKGTPPGLQAAATRHERQIIQLLTARPAKRRKDTDAVAGRS